MNRPAWLRVLPESFGIVALVLVAGCGGDPSPSGGGSNDHASGSVTPPPGASSTLEPTDGVADASAVAPPPVALAAVVGGVSACPQGYAHPNVCCHASPLGGVTCTESLAPFAPCDVTASTSPDPVKCCSLSTDAASCVAPPSSAPSDSPPDPASSCTAVCGPGSYPAPLGISCSNVSAGEACDYCCELGGDCPTSQPACLCPDSGDGATACNCGSTYDCDACPAGWSAPQGKPDLCCRTLGGPTQCYSQATYVGGPGSTDACDLHGDSCACERMTGDGHIYEVICDASQTPACACVVDGVTTSTYSTPGCPSVAPSSSGPTFVSPNAWEPLYSACGFPSP